MEETKTFTVTIEGLKRTTVEVLAHDEDEAKSMVENNLRNNGLEGIEFDEMFDSLKVTEAHVGQK